MKVNCFLYAVCKQLANENFDEHKLREMSMDRLTEVINNMDDDTFRCWVMDIGEIMNKQQYLRKMRANKTWYDEAGIISLAEALNVVIHIYSIKDNKLRTLVINDGKNRKVLNVFYNNIDHYDSLKTKVN